MKIKITFINGKTQMYKCLRGPLNDIVTSFVRLELEKTDGFNTILLNKDEIKTIEIEYEDFFK